MSVPQTAPFVRAEFDWESDAPAEWPAWTDVPLPIALADPDEAPLSAPAIEDAIDLARFPTTSDFPARVFEVANLLLDVSDPVCKFLAEEIAKIGDRARFLGATTPEEYDARNDLQEQWRTGGAR